MTSLRLVNLLGLMERSGGDPGVRIGLVDGPVAVGHPDLGGGPIVDIGRSTAGPCARPDSPACRHGTYVAGILAARRGAAAPAIAPGCTLLVRPIFAEQTAASGGLPAAATEELAAAVVDCVRAGARVINLSLAVTRSSPRGDADLREALGHAARREVLVVAAAGNQGEVGCSPLTGHPWVIPVVAGDRAGRPLALSNLGGSIGRNGLIAPGDAIPSLGAGGPGVTAGGTSAAAPFVTGAIALLWSLHPTAAATRIKAALVPAGRPWRAGVVPALLDAARAAESLSRIPLPETGGPRWDRQT